MQVHSHIPSHASQKGLCATIGNFDGLHLGHRALINQTFREAQTRGLDLAIISFWPHPREILHASQFHAPLVTREERTKLLETLGVPLLIELPFTPEFAALSASDFIAGQLCPAGLRHLVIGHDFTLGHNREGTFEVLQDLSRQHGFGVTRLNAINAGAFPVSSSRLRNLISEGKVEEAATLLGRVYSIKGTIENGDGRGRKLGFPTANLGGISTLIPGSGIYATVAHIDGKSWKAITNIGSNPTFGGKKQTVETFLLDATGDFYGKKMQLDFIERLRDERKFPSADALAAQISKDAARARQVLEMLAP